MSSVDSRLPHPALRAYKAPAEVDLNATLASGQTFAWQSVKTSWQGWIGDRAVTLLPQTATGSTPDWIRNYFSLDLDWRKLHAEFAHDPSLRTATQSFPGLRLVRDPWWPCLVGFLCSPLKPIPQIRILHHRLRTTLGYGRFPSPEQIASVGESALRQCGLGYRARFIHACAVAVVEGRWTWDLTPGMPLAEACQRLCLLPGIGDKIARCVLLYTGTCLDAFPVDVWTARILATLYWRKKRAPRLPELIEIADRRFGPWAGIAQLYLFHWFRAVQGKVART
ncbi:MAG: DNA-3-methyladenine glycosylase [Candidatus Methylacidiphilales bacterium]